MFNYKYVFILFIITVFFISNHVVASDSNNLNESQEINFQNKVNIQKGHIGAIRCLAMDSQSRYIFSGGEDGTVKKWNMKGELLKTMIGCIKGVTAIQVSNDDKKIFASSDYGIILVWDLDGNLIKKIETAEPYTKCLSIALSPNSKYLISGGEDGLIKIWNTEDFKLIKSIQGAMEKSIDSVKLGPNGKWITSEGIHSKPVNTISISPDSNYIITTANDSKMKIRNLKGEELCLLFDSYNNPKKIDIGFANCAIFIDSNTIISGHQNGKIGIWNLNGNLLKEINVENNGEIYAIKKFEYNKDKYFLVVSSDYGDNTYLYSQKYEFLKQIGENKCENMHYITILEGCSIRKFYSEDNIVFISQDNKYIIRGYLDGSIEVWSTNL